MTHSALPRSIRHPLLLACALALALVPTLPAQVRFSWVRAGSSGNHNLGYNVAVGSDGSVAAAGLMDYYINLGSTNFYAYANSGNRDALLTKYSGAGELLWARADGGGSSEEARGSAIDAAGNTYTCGFFGGTTYFGSTNLVSRGSDDMFLAKYSPSGEVLWVVQAGGPSPDYGWRVAVDSQGQPVVVGTFYGTMDFGGTNLTAIGNQQVFVAKYSSGGALLWASRLAGNGDIFSHGITVGSGGETYVSGYFNNNLQYDERCTFAIGGLDGFLARLSNTGTVDWVRASGGNEVEYGQGVAVSSDGTVWTCGYFYGSLPAVGTNLISVGNYNIYLSRYSSNGTLLHGQSFGGSANDYATALAIDGETNVYVAGYFESSPLSFPGTNLYTAGGQDLFLLRLDAAGNFRWATRVGGGNAEYAYGLAVSQNRDLYLTGFYSYGTTFGDTNFSTSSSYGFYLAKYTRDLPVFLTQPASQVLSEGSTLSLSVTVTSSTPLSLQWQLNGTNLPGATNATLIIPGASPLDSGAYTLRAGNTEGFVPSDPASVLITSFSTTLSTTGLVWSTGGDAVWYSQTNIAFDGPESARSGSITNNQQTWLQTRVVGPARVSYYWKVSSENGYDFLRFSLNGVELTNTSGKVEWKLVSFLVPAGTNLLRWTYTKDESESVGSDGGWLDAVSVVYAPAIPVPPPSLVVTSGIQVTLQAPVTGTAPFLYQWQWFGTNLPGATAATLTLSNVQPNQAGPYILVASNAAGVTASAPGLLTVLTPPALTLQPVDQTVSPGADVLFTAGASGSGTLAYQWLFQGQPIPGATNASLLLTNVQSTQVGAYQIQVSSSTGTTLSPPARLTLTGLVLRPTLFVEGRIGDTYRIEYREGIKATNWLTLTNLTLTVSPTQVVDYSAEGRPERYYRVIAQ